MSPIGQLSAAGEAVAVTQSREKCRAHPPQGFSGLLRDRHLLLASSPQGCHLYLISPHDSSVLSNSFHHLQLFNQITSNVTSSFFQDSCFSSFSLMTDCFQESLQPPGGPPATLFQRLKTCPTWVGGHFRRGAGATAGLTEEAYHMGSEGRQQQVPELRAWLFSGGQDLRHNILPTRGLCHSKFRYVQGRTDRLSPRLLRVTLHEAGASAVFVAQPPTVFVASRAETQKIMKRQLLLLLKVLDRPLRYFPDSHHSGSLCFSVWREYAPSPMAFSCRKHCGCGQPPTPTPDVGLDTLCLLAVDPEVLGLALASEPHSLSLPTPHCPTRPHGLWALHTDPDRTSSLEILPEKGEEAAGS
ncbi:hypothetical protein AB1E19_001401 [Capra hircus]